MMGKNLTTYSIASYKMDIPIWSVDLPASESPGMLGKKVSQGLCLKLGVCIFRDGIMAPAFSASSLVMLMVIIA